MNKTIKISVLMTAYNTEKFIEAAIQSVLEQTFTDFEFIIINDGSTDRTKEMIDSFNDPRIILINQTNKGIAEALNNGLKIAKSNLIARFDADDICYADRLEKQYNFLLNNPEYIIVGSSADYIDEDGDYVFTYHSPVTNEKIQSLKNNTCPLIHSSVLYRKDIIADHGGYSIYAHNFEDHFLWITILNKGKAFNFYEPLIKVRLNPASVTIDDQWRTKKFRRIKKNALRKKFITKEEGQELLKIIQSQNIRQVKEGAYYSLLAKKYLWNNYQPQKARENLKKVLAGKKYNWKSYFFFLLSFLPEAFLQKWYRLFKTR